MYIGKVIGCCKHSSSPSGFKDIHSEDDFTVRDGEQNPQSLFGAKMHCKMYPKQVRVSQIKWVILNTILPLCVSVPPLQLCKETLSTFNIKVSLRGNVIVNIV